MISICDKCSNEFNLGYSDHNNGSVCVQCLYEGNNLNDEQIEFSKSFFENHRQYVPTVESAESLRERLVMTYKRFTIIIISIITWLVFLSAMYSSINRTGLIGFVISGAILLIFLVVYYYKWLSALNQSFVATNVKKATKKIVLSALVLFYGFIQTNRLSMALGELGTSKLVHGRLLLI